MDLYTYYQENPASRGLALCLGFIPSRELGPAVPGAHLGLRVASRWGVWKYWLGTFRLAHGRRLVVKREFDTPTSRRLGGPRTSSTRSPSDNQLAAGSVHCVAGKPLTLDLSFGEVARFLLSYPLHLSPCPQEY